MHRWLPNVYDSKFSNCYVASLQKLFKKEIANHSAVLASTLGKKSLHWLPGSTFLKLLLLCLLIYFSLASHTHCLLTKC